MTTRIGGKATPGWSLTQLIEPLAVTVLLFNFVYVGRSILGLLAPIAVMIILAQRLPQGFSGFWRNLLTPFAPLIVVTLVASFFMETLTETLAYWAFATVYLIARIMRYVISPSSVLLAAAIVGFFVAVVRQLSLTPFGASLPLVERLAAELERNPAGTATAFGFVSLLIVGWYLSKPKMLRVGLTIWLALLALLLFISDVMTGVIGAAAAAFALAAVSLFSYWRSSRQKDFLRPDFWLVGLVVGLVGVIIIAVVNFASAAGADVGSDVVKRDFTNFTGRIDIWTCYLDIVGAGLPDPWMKTLECTGHNHANLHNTYLESHLISGIPGFLAVVFAFVATVWISARMITRAKDRTEALQGVLGLGLGMLGLVFGLAESYLFVYVYPAFFVFYAAPEWTIRWPKKRALRES